MKAESLIHHIALLGIPKVGYSFYHFILSKLNEHQLVLADAFDNPKLLSDVLSEADATSSSLSSFGKDKITELVNHIKQLNWQAAEQAMLWQEQTENHIFLESSFYYPSLLKQVDNNPPLLYAKGNINLLRSAQLAIVGSRNPTPSGYKTAYNFSSFLAEAGLTITSGMALGIDAASHLGCLSQHGPTIAVTGTGLDRVYPAKHRDLAYQIAEKGLLLSEFALGTGPNKYNFPRRNQIISGLSVGTLVVEAALQSGSLITAHAALEQGREVFAIPGSIHNPLSRGCHQLIKQGAKLVEHGQDIIDEISPLIMANIELNTSSKNTEAIEVYKPDSSNIVKTSLNKEQTTSLESTHNESSSSNNLLTYIDYTPATINQLCEQSQLAIDEINAQLSILELEGRIEILADGKIILANS